jgi:hypothetical protein
MNFVRRNNPHLRLTAAILVAVLAALAGGIAADPTGTSDPRSRRLELGSVLRLVVTDEARRAETGVHPPCLACVVTSHAKVAAMAASDRSDNRAERALRRLAAHSRAAQLKTTALPPPLA